MTEIDELKGLILALTAKVETLTVKGSHVLPSSTTVENWLLQWLNAYKLPKVRPATFRDYSALVKNYLLPALGGKLLGDLTALDIQSFFGSLPNSRTRQLLKTLLNAALKKAAASGLILRNPCADIELKTYRKTSRKAFTVKEEKRFLRALQGSYYRVNFLVYLYTGIRKTEIKRLRFDFAKKLVYVDGTKTRASARAVPLTGSLIAELKTYFAAGRDLAKNTKNLSIVFQGVCRKAKLTGYCLHSLRHTFATRCLENGVPLKVLQSWLGHSTFEVTANTYSHVTPEYSKKEAKKLAKNISDFARKPHSKKL